MASIVRAHAAEADALDIWLYVAIDNPAAADRPIDRFDEIFHELASHPQLGKRIEEVAPGLRFFPIASYLIFYRETDDGIEIARFLHGSRDITADFFRD